MSEVVSADNLCRSFGDVTALDSVSFSFSGPQVIGVLGPNGAGKTTLLEILEGLREPSSGSFRLFGEPCSHKVYPKRRVGVVLQKEIALDRITVRDYAELFAAIYGERGGDRRIIESASLSAREKVPVERLSGGEAQRLFIFAAVVHRPDLLFLDEPTAHLDPENKAHIGELIREMGKSRTVLLTTHDLAEADAVCDNLLFLVGGRVKAAGKKEDLKSAVPPEKRRGEGLVDAFFHYCDARIDKGGALE